MLMFWNFLYGFIMKKKKKKKYLKYFLFLAELCPFPDYCPLKIMDAILSAKYLKNY